MNRVDFFDYTVHEPPQQAPANHKGSYVGVLCFVLVVSVAAMVFLRQPISDAASARAARGRIELEERRQQAEQEALNRAVEPRIVMLDDKLHGLELAIQELAVQFHQATAVPLDRAHETVTREIDYLILDSDTFATAWHRMKDARISRQQFEGCAKTLADIRNCLHDNSLDRIHITQLDALLAWIDGQAPLLETQRDCLQTMQNELAGRRPASKGGMWQCF